MQKRRPDFETIADFRRENRAVFKSVLRQFTSLCRDLELFGGELLALETNRFPHSLFGLLCKNRDAHGGVWTKEIACITNANS